MKNWLLSSSFLLLLLLFCSSQRDPGHGRTTSVKAGDPSQFEKSAEESKPGAGTVNMREKAPGTAAGDTTIEVPSPGSDRQSRIDSIKALKDSQK